MKYFYQRFSTVTCFFVAVLFLILNLESCTTHRGIVSCPDIHSHRTLAMHHLHYHNGAATAHKHSKNNNQPQANTKQVNVDAVTTQPAKLPVDMDGMASLSISVPNFKSPKGIYKVLTEDERQEVKNEMSTAFSKHPLLNKIVAQRMDKMDKKYPAPAQSVLKQGGNGSLSTGEILSIVAIVLSVLFPLGIVGLILGIIALSKINREGGRDWARILAILAIVFGALSFLAFLIWLFLIVIFVGRG